MIISLAAYSGKSMKPSILLSLDINASFEILDHIRLLKRAYELFGLNDHVLSWFKFNLTGRSSYAALGN